ncbi:MAG: tyrosine-type recombinase/integrase [Pirellulaceae bacterium]|nr:tyrosine-type recombinase/integrase [Pirellulaceae bacterium]
MSRHPAYESEFYKSLNYYHRRAVLAFSRWLGREATLGDITRANLAEFQQSPFYSALKPRSARDACCALRSIGGFPKKRKSTGTKETRSAKKPKEPPSYDPGTDLCEEHNGEITLRHFFFKHYKPKRLLGKSPNTIRLYEIQFRKLSRFMGRPAVLSDLNDDNVSSYLAAEADGNSMHTVAKEFGQLVAIWRFAVRRQFLTTWPELVKPEASKPIPDAWTREELASLFEAIGWLEGDYSGIPASLWWEALVRIVLDTGERIGALLQVKWDDLQDEWLTVPAVSRKGKHSGKVFKLSEKTLEVLSQMRGLNQEPVVFPWAWTDTYLWNRFGKILKDAGLPCGRRSKFHKIRRTVATYYEVAGGNATVLLGHSSRKITEAYIDQRFVKTPQPCDLIEPY